MSKAAQSSKRMKIKQKPLDLAVRTILVDRTEQKPDSKVSREKPEGRKTTQ